jgi:hypothetical protein
VKNLLLVCTLLLLTASAQSQEKKGCLDGVCIGMDVRAVPKNLPWRLVELPGPDANPKDVADGRNNVTVFASRIYPNSEKAIAKLVDAINYDLGNFDASVLGVLPELTAACKQFPWTGTFKSKSGFSTTVTLMVYPEAGDLPIFRVQKIRRTFPDIGVGEELTNLKKQIEASIGMKVNDNDVAPLSKQPVAVLATSPKTKSATLEILDMPRGSFDLRAFGKDQACLNRVKVN